MHRPLRAGPVSAFAGDYMPFLRASTGGTGLNCKQSLFTYTLRINRSPFDPVTTGMANT